MLFLHGPLQLILTVRPPSDCPRLRFMLNAWLHVRVINFRIIYYIIGYIRFRGSKGCCHGNHFWISIYGVHIAATWRIRLNGPCAAAMRPYVKLLWALVRFYYSSSELQKVLFLAPSFCGFCLFMKYLGGTAEQICICTKFTRKTCLVPIAGTSLKVTVTRTKTSMASSFCHVFRKRPCSNAFEKRKYGYINRSIRLFTESHEWGHFIS